MRLFLGMVLLGLSSLAGLAADPDTNAPPVAPLLTNAAPETNAGPHAKPGAAPGKNLDALPVVPVEKYKGPFPRPLDSYGDEQSVDTTTVLIHRGFEEPFNLIATIIFLLAIAHTFLAPKILAWSHDLQSAHNEALEEQLGADLAEKVPRRQRQSIPAAILHFFGEVEVVFGLWVIPLAVAIVVEKGPGVARAYFDEQVSYVEPLFVVVIMAIAASRPVVDFAMRVLALAAGSSPVRWWFALLTIGPLLGSFITEPAAMTLCALLLGREFYRLDPSPRFMYATLGLLFVNVSVGGALTNFAAPPILIVAAKWDWSTLYLLEQFGVRATGGILVGNLVYFLIFRKQFEQLAAFRNDLPPDDDDVLEPVPFWVTAIHLGFLAFTVYFAREPALFIGGFLFFLGFTMATTAYQDEINLRPPILVGFFLGGLVIHGGLQGWWIEPVLSRLTEYPLMLTGTVLTAFNDNAAITYLATLVPDLGDSLKDAVVSGAIAGGGLTVIANAPNPAGQSILQKYFPEGGISPFGLLLAALFPTLVMLGLFALPR